MINIIKKTINLLLPKQIKKLALSYKFFFTQKISKNKHLKSIRTIKNKKQIKVAFFLISSDTWKYDSLYFAFKKQEKFEPIVVICPFTSKGEHFLEKEMTKAETLCQSRSYKYIVGYDKKRDESISFKSFYKPDIVFFSNPNNLTDQEFLITNYLDTLTCYVPYSFRIDSLYNYSYNNNLVNLTWKNFYETSFHKEFAKKYARNKGSNVIVTGHPQLDQFFDRNKTNYSDPWKNFDSLKRKRVIWGPHWTIKGFQNSGLDWACFLDFADYFLELAADFKDSVQFAIKPHPFLRGILEKKELWGQEKTSEYFNRWEEGQNTQLVEGNYINLFKYSDALIHDSGAFMVEYLALNKPAAYTINREEPMKSLNDFGISALNTHTKIRSKEELKIFITEIINGVDLMKEKRTVFLTKHLGVPEPSVAEQIVNYISKTLWKN